MVKYHKSYHISVIVLAVSLIITAVVWQNTRHAVAVKERLLFVRESQKIEDVMKYRLDDYIEVLFGLQSLFATDKKISRGIWQAYCENLDLRSRIPGVHSLSFHARVPASQKIQFLEHVRSDTTFSPQGFPTFDIFPIPGLNGQFDHQQEVFYIVDYIWPWDENKEAHGRELFSNPSHRRMIEQARDTGKPVASSKMTLTREFDTIVPSFVIYLPVYAYGVPITTKEERQQAIRGILAETFIVPEFIDSALQRIIRHPEITIEIFDATVLDAGHLYYDDDETLNVSNVSSLPPYSRITSFSVYGQTWSIFFFTTPDFGLDTSEVYFPSITLGVGILVSLLLTGTVFSLSTSRIRAVRIAEQMTEELEKQQALSMRSDRLRSLGEMAAGIAHELNQPLVGVRGLAEHLLIAQDRGWNLDAQTIRKKVATIIEQADRMTHIIDHIRIFAREAGKPEFRPVNINDVIETGTHLISAQFALHGLSLEKKLVVNPPQVMANPFTLEEVVLNLLANARDAVEERLSTEPDMKSPGVFLRTDVFPTHTPTHVSIEICDNGSGIPDEIREKIFDPFFTTKAPDKGTGLGLAISKTIIEDFGGTLTIMPSPSQEGTIATITLPVQRSLCRQNGTYTEYFIG